MPRYLLDTNICIYLTKLQHPALIERFSSLAENEIAISMITYGELQLGAQKSQQRSKALQAIENLTQAIPVLVMPKQAGKMYGEIRATLQQKGTPIGNNDLWIAAHALSENLILVTNNEKEFLRVYGLTVENWVAQ